MKHIILKINRLVISVLLVSFFSVSAQDVCPPSFNPPGGLAVDKVPQFVCFGFDDNNYGDGMNWIVDFLKTKANPGGSANPATFDGKPVKVTFLIKGMIESSEPEQDVLNSWKKAYENGHEIGNHTFQHIAVDIENELRKCDSVLQTLGVPIKEIVGFRTPQLAVVPSVFDAIYKRKFLYDCTIEHHTEITNKQFIWPYTLEKGMDLTAFGGFTCNYSGLWELPVHEFVDASGNKVIPGFDYNAFINSGMSGSAFGNVLKNSLDYHMKTNRCPLFIGAHTDLYATTNVGSTASSRRSGVQDFITYALGKQEVRIVPYKDVIAWMRNPVGLGQTYIQSPAVSVNAKTILIKHIDKASITMAVSAPGMYTINLFTISGKNIFSDRIRITTAGQIYTILPKGIGLNGNYIFSVTGEGLSLQKSLLIF